MARRFSNNNLVERIPQNPRLVRNHIRPPFWYSTPNYYILAVAISVAIFFVMLLASEEPCKHYLMLSILHFVQDLKNILRHFFLVEFLRTVPV